MKKGATLISLIVVVLIIVLLIVFLNIKPKEFVLEEGVPIPEELCSKLPDYFAISQPGCPHCAIVMPRLKELENELSIIIKYYDLSINENRAELTNAGVYPKGVPTVVINCEVFVGEKSKEFFREKLLL
ncbi:MAG: hypothetical protein ABH817_01270 [archaeon]